MDMRRFGLLILSALLAVSGHAKDEFGCLGDVRAKHPDFFKPGVVSIAKLNQEDWYVYCGDAEKCLDSETDDELYEEAQVQAKMNFFNYFAKKDPAVKVDVVGARIMYRCADKELRLVVMGVPAKGVTVRPGAPKAAAGVEVEAAGPPEPNASVNQNKAILKEGNAPSEADGSVAKAETPVVKADGSVSKGEECARNPEKNDSGRQETPQCSQDDISDDEKLDILRERIMANPGDYRIRARMARIFARQGKVRRALNNYNDAIRLLIANPGVPDYDRAVVIMETAQYEEAQAGEYALALKHYRMVLRMGGAELAKKANDRISFLLLRF